SAPAAEPAPVAEPAKPAEPAMAAAPAAEEPAPAAPAPATDSHVVVAGDNYWKIAEKIYGDGEKWKLISEANPEHQPMKLPVGATLKIPPAS
ncbi:MAG: LysM peptidoglycan-binding domain-containing protein, partial [Pseudaminobacter sp.]|nr:LysM peptidoglycan-binding domain-containing protein [Pseudaminobacter sp.]